MKVRTRINICGVTDPDTARAAVAAGADAIGLIFHPPSARHLQLAQAARIRHAAGPFVATVAVMVNPDAAQVDEIIAQVRPSCLQFHGEEPPDFCAGFGLPYLKAVRITGTETGAGAGTKTGGTETGTEEANLPALESRYDSAQGILLDTHAPDQYGGTGVPFDWARARYGGSLPLILAGGLSAGNVAEALAEVAPYGVDVSTGVETDGRKDPEKIRQFCQKVHNLNS